MSCRRACPVIAVVGSAILLVGAAVAGAGCSSKDRRDQNYGTDTGTTYVPPEAGPPPPPRVRTDAGDAGDGGPQSDAPDGPGSSGDAGDDRASPDAPGARG